MKRRTSPIDQVSGKQALTAIFSGIMFVSDFVEEIEKGRDLLTAGRRARQKTKRRVAALARAELEVVEEDGGAEDARVEVKRVKRA
jgi:hypothetical protein